MRPRLGLVLGAAVLGGLAAASLAAGQAGPRTAIEVIAPASAVGGLLGSPSHAAPAPGLGPGWLLLPTLPDLSIPAAPSQPPGPPPTLAVPTIGGPAPVAAGSPVAAVLTSLPVQPPAVSPVLPTLPSPPPPISLPPITGGHHHRDHHQHG
jgi:hypothetical protein